MRNELLVFTPPRNNRATALAAGLYLVALWITMTACTAEEAVAQVEWKDRYITIASDDQTNPSVARQAPVGFAYTVVVWEHRNTNGETDIYAQKIDRENGFAQWWPRDGVPVCTYSGDQKNPRAAFDSLGGVIVVWEDERDPVQEVYAQRLQIVDGSPDPAWPLDGTMLSASGYRAERPRIVGTSDGAYVAWIDWRNSPEGGALNRDIYLQYITFMGWPASGWATGGTNIHSDPDPDQINAELALDHIWVDVQNVPKIGVVVVYQDNRNASSTSGLPAWTIYADRYDATNVRIYGDNECGIDPTTTEDQINPCIVATGAELTEKYCHAFVTWQDARYLNPGVYDLFGQRLDELGNRVAGATGMLICDVQGEQRNPCMTLWEQPEILGVQDYRPYVAVAWEDVRTGAFSGVYAALIDFPDAVTTVLTNPNGTAGEEISQETDVDLTEVAIDNVPVLTGFYESDVNIAWKRPYPIVANSNIHYQSIRIPSWSLNKPQNGWPVTEAKENQSRPQVAGEIFIYEDARRNPLPQGDAQDDVNIYCQKPGCCVSEKEMQWCEMFAQWTPGTNAANLRQVVDPLDQSIFVVWDEERNGERAVYIQKFDRDGVPRWTNNGVRVSAIGTTGQFPDVVPDFGNGGAQVVWQQNATNQPEEVWYAHVTFMGVVTPQQIGLPNGVAGSQLRPVCVEHLNVVNPPGIPGIVYAYLLDEGGGTVSRCMGAVDIANPVAHTKNHIANATINAHEELKIVNDNAGGCYLMSHGIISGTNGLINVTYCEENTFFPGRYSFHEDQNTIYTSFGGYDMVMDVFRSIPANAYHATVAYSINSTPASCMDVFVQRYAFDGTDIAFTTPFNVSILWTADHTATTPAITFDNEYLNPYGGVIVAWDHQYPVQPGVYRHDVETNQVVWFGAWPPFGQMPIPPLSVATGYVQPTWPDISHVRNIQPWDEPQGYVVWQGMTEACSPSRPLEIMGDLVDYQGCPPYTRGPQWSTGAPNYRRVDPGAGYYSQMRPCVQKSGEDGVVFWYDTRTGLASIAGTTMFDKPNDIDWRKRRGAEDQPVAECTIGQNYPNPVSLSSGRDISVDVTLPAEESVSLHVYDLLGRRIATVFEGVLSAGAHSIRIDAGTLARYCAPGVYLYSLQARRGVTARLMVVTR
jgi:hypothetical protein